MITVAELVPLFRVQEPSLNTFAIREVVDSFLREHGQLCFHEGQLSSQMPLIGTDDALLETLALLLNETLGEPWNFTVATGMFAHPAHDDHQWLHDRGVIVDIGVMVLKDSPLLGDDVKSLLAPYSYYVSDNPTDAVYRLYTDIDTDDV